MPQRIGKFIKHKIMTYIPELIVESPSIDSKSTGASSMGLAKKTLRPLFVQFEVVAGDSISVGCSVSVGTNSTDYDNILPITALTTLLATGTIITIPLLAVVGVVAAGAEIFAKVTSAATGTTQTIKARLLSN